MARSEPYATRRTSTDYIQKATSYTQNNVWQTGDTPGQVRACMCVCVCVRARVCVYVNGCVWPRLSLSLWVHWMKEGRGLRGRQRRGP